MRQTTVDDQIIAKNAEKAALLALQLQTKTREGHEVMDTLAVARDLREQADDIIHGLVTVAREAEVPWHFIGSKLGVTAQGAQQRYRR